MEAGLEMATGAQLDKLARALNMQTAELAALASGADMPGPAPAPAFQEKVASGAAGRAQM